MKAGKWNHKTREYDYYETPEEWHTPLYTDNMEEIVNCAQCGREIAYGDCYTSREIHNGYGFGYPVCEDCLKEEWERERNMS